MKKESSINFWHPASLICTCFGVGKIPFAPGTWGSLAGVLLFFAVEEYVLLASILLYFLGVFASDIYAKKTGKKDASEIVVDEVVGQWLAIYIAFSLVSYFSATVQLNGGWVQYVVVFAAFRVFDIVKRGPVGWVDRNVKGGMGVMLDDVVAGVLAGASSALIFMAWATI